MVPLTVAIMVPVHLRVNGIATSVSIDAGDTLLDLSRRRLGLTGSKRVCDRGECGACTVLLDGRPVYSCLLLAATCDGQSVTTIEGISGSGLHPVQQAFIETDALQCGFCTPGQILSVVALLSDAQRPSSEQVTEALSGNLCRCGTYPKILRAIGLVEKAARRRRRTGRGGGRSARRGRSRRSSRGRAGRGSGDVRVAG